MHVMSTVLNCRRTCFWPTGVGMFKIILTSWWIEHEAGLMGWDGGEKNKPALCLWEGETLDHCPWAHIRRDRVYLTDRIKIRMHYDASDWWSLRGNAHLRNFPSFLIQMCKLVNNRLNDLLQKHFVSVHSVKSSFTMPPLICTKPSSKTTNLTLQSQISCTRTWT